MITRPIGFCVVILALAMMVACDDAFVGSAAKSAGGKKAGSDEAAGAKAGGGAGAAVAKGREVICDLDGVKKYVHVDRGGALSWDLTVSHTGTHVAVTRAVKYSMNNYMHRVEIDGQRGPTFRSIGIGRWSDDGNTLVYGGENFQGQLPGSHVVHKGTRHGPYGDLRALAVSPDGASWATLARSKLDTADGPALELALVVDGNPRSLPSQHLLVETLQFDATAKTFVYQGEGNQWLSVDGKPASAPTPTQRTVLPLPTGTTIAVNRVGKGKDVRRQLVVNGKTIGEFEAVIHRPGSPVPAYPQADGTFIIYVVEENNLIRLRI